MQTKKPSSFLDLIIIKRSQNFFKNMLLPVFSAVWSWQPAFFISGPEKGLRVKSLCQVTTVRARSHRCKNCLKSSRARSSLPVTKNKMMILVIYKTSQLSHMKAPVNPRSQDERQCQKRKTITTKN